MNAPPLGGQTLPIDQVNGRQEWITSQIVRNVWYFYYPDGTEDAINYPLITDIVTRYQGSIWYAYLQLYFYYQGLQNLYGMWGIYESNMDSPPLWRRPRNYVTTNYAKYIVDNNASYFVGKPLTYNIDNEPLNEYLTDLSKKNFEGDHNYKIAKDMGIYGYGAEILYQDEEGETKYKYVPAYQSIFIYSDSDYNKLLFAIRYYIMPTTSFDIRGEVYTKDEVIVFDNTKIVSREKHFFGIIPMIPYNNNNDIIGDFIQVIDILDTYNNMEMISANDFEYFSNAILLLRGYQGTTDEELRKLFRDRILLTDEDGDASYLMKDIPYESQEKYKERLLNDMQTISNTPILTNLKGGENTTATAVRFKLLGMEQQASQKERGFRKAIQTRNMGILNIYNKKFSTNLGIEDIAIQFHRNVPENQAETIDMVVKLTGIVSEETQLEQIPFVEDVQAEMLRKKAERKEILEQSMETGTFSTDDSEGFANAEASVKDSKEPNREMEEEDQ